MVGIGSEKEVDNFDGYDSLKENIRIAAASNYNIPIYIHSNYIDEYKKLNFSLDGCRSLIDCGIEDIYVSSMGDPESAAEGSILGTWKFQEYKKKRDSLPRISLLEEIDKLVKY